MKSTGIVRKVDELGRIVLPIELRRTLDIAQKDSLEIYVDGDSVILKSRHAFSAQRQTMCSLISGKTSVQAALMN